MDAMVSVSRKVVVGSWIESEKEKGEIMSSNLETLSLFLRS